MQRLLVACLAFGWIAVAEARTEELLVQGMGRTVGWAVADAAGEIAFRDCNGRQVALAGGGLEPTTRRCEKAPEKVTMRGLVRQVDRDRRVLVLVRYGGGEAAFYVGAGALGALASVSPGDHVELRGPVPGHAAEIVLR
jgi:hypothetical protein